MNAYWIFTTMLKVLFYVIIHYSPHFLSSLLTDGEK